MALAELTIVIYLVGEWPTFHRRPMIEALARNAIGWANVLCVNPVASIREIGGIRAWRELIDGRLQQVDSNLFVLTPCIAIPGLGRRGIRFSPVRWIVARQIRSAVARIGVSGPIVAWVYRPEEIDCVRLAAEDFTVYECYDEYSLSHINGSRIPGVEDKEKDLMEKIDLVFTTSYSLFESRRKKHPNVNYAPNGVDFDLFNQATKNELLIANDLKKIPSPRIGYVGNLSGRIDFSLIKKIAKHEKDWSIVIIGPVEEEVKAELVALKHQGNVYYLGYKPRKILPQYLKGFDVCILPLKIHGWNEHSNPLKLWEYLAAGRPVVTTPTAETGGLDEILWLANGTSAFVAATEEALEDSDGKRIGLGVEIARQHSWHILTRQMFSVVYDACSKMRASCL